MPSFLVIDIVFIKAVLVAIFVTMNRQTSSEKKVIFISSFSQASIPLLLSFLFFMLLSISAHILHPRLQRQGVGQVGQVGHSVRRTDKERQRKTIRGDVSQSRHFHSLPPTSFSFLAVILAWAMARCSLPTDAAVAMRPVFGAAVPAVDPASSAIFKAFKSRSVK